MSGTVYELQDKQRLAVEPKDSVWLSASAGTGKTQVLSARVLRLLLEPGADPSQVLCLTFTKAGAAEMAVRVNAVLARWVRMDEAQLGRELAYLGASADPDTRARARSLFARVLDCPGGGLRIDTIHAFAQYLLAAFPGEAGMLPGARPMEDRERDLLSREVLSDLLAGGSPTVVEAIAEMSRRKGPDAVRGWLMRCARHMDLWQGSGSWQPPMQPRVHRLLGIPADVDESWIAEACSDEAFDLVSMRRCLSTLEDWDTKGGRDASAAIKAWLAADTAGRALTIGSLHGTLFTADGSKAKNLHHIAKRDPEFEEYAERVRHCVGSVNERAALISLAGFLAPQLEAGRAFALAWDKAKEREGLVDFDDLIARAASLLADGAMADWIRYKLDRSFDHILVDEAQDTNAAQWAIVKALTDDYFDGAGARGDAVRTIFAVGDYKQAIFGFQGTSPENFREARDYFRDKMNAAAQAAREMRGGPDARGLEEYGLGRSYRTNQRVLGFVDQAIDAIGHEAFGLDQRGDPHEGNGEPGLVGLWQVVRVAEDKDDSSENEGWLARHDRRLADRIARQIAQWLDRDGDGFTLSKGTPRRATAGDIMVLVQKRRDLASLIVARLYRHGVPVAGVDRLRLGNPLAVKDLMAALRFAAQPLDDLTLASLLVSPLLGWSQEDLLAHGYRSKGVRLWEHLRDSDDDRVRETVDSLREILRRADYDSPQQLLHWILIGPLDGRRRLVARLGREANDPIDELLNAANAYAAAHTASLQGFIRWFDAGDGELKREAGEGGDQVRVMTVHGSKGLEAPIVILADAAIRPDGAGDLVLSEEIPGASARVVPLPGLTKEEKVGPVATADSTESAKAMQEHWRLLYVALTRAQEALFITGSLGPRDARTGPHEDSWYARLASLFDADEAVEDPIWGARWELGERAPSVAVEPTSLSVQEAMSPVPEWATRPVGPEPRPPRPLAPSGLGEVEGSDPPLPPSVAGAAARRGTLIHALLERLPQRNATDRAGAGSAWLDRIAADLTREDREEMLESALAVLRDPDFAAVFGPDALAEVSLAATVEGQVVMGTADRLLVTEKTVTVIDFKTARRPPARPEDIPDSTMKQMAAYVAALEIIYPGRRVEAGVLYTQTPQLFALPAQRLAAYKSAFAAPQESFALPPVE